MLLVTASLLGVCCSLVTAVTTPKCNADNCLRGLRATGSKINAASSFCATYTQGISTASTGFPSFATSACMNNPSRFSSACSCLPTVTSTTSTSSTTSSSTSTSSTSSTSPTCDPLATPVLVNGDFETGQLAPWYIIDDPNASSGIVSPGENSNFCLHSNNMADPSGNSPYSHAACYQQLTTCPGVTYTVTFDFRYDDYAYDAYVLGLIDGNIIREYRDQDGIQGQWQQFSAQFVAQSTNPVFGLGGVVADYESMNYDYDNVQIVPVLQ